MGPMSRPLMSVNGRWTGTPLAGEKTWVTNELWSDDRLEGVDGPMEAKREAVEEEEEENGEELVDEVLRGRGVARSIGLVVERLRGILTRVRGMG
jgi:hypothetical protein